MPCAPFGFLLGFNHKFVFQMVGVGCRGLLLWRWLLRLLSFSSSDSWWNLINSNEIVIGNGMMCIVLDRLRWVHILLLLPWPHLLHAMPKLIHIWSKWRLNDGLLIKILMIGVKHRHGILIMQIVLLKRLRLLIKLLLLWNIPMWLLRGEISNWLILHVCLRLFINLIRHIKLLIDQRLWIHFLDNGSNTHRFPQLPGLFF